MTTMRASILLRTISRSTHSFRSIPIPVAPLLTFPCLRFIPVATNSAKPVPPSRYYSTTPYVDDIKLYSFNDINSVSKAPKDQYIIDVREPQELKDQGKIPNAINLPFSSLQESLSLPDPAFKEKFDFPKPEKEKEVIFYCKAGVRSTNASLMAKGAGYKKIGNYTGSFDDWIARKGTVAKVA